MKNEHKTVMVRKTRNHSIQINPKINTQRETSEEKMGLPHV